MIHARRDYDRIQDPDSKIPLDEPVFLIRGQDPVGAAVVRYWAQLTFDLMNRSRPEEDQELLSRAIDVHARKMQQWAGHVDHGPATMNRDQLRLF